MGGGPVWEGEIALAGWKAARAAPSPPILNPGAAGTDKRS